MSSEDIGAIQPGAVLSQARQAQAVTVREVADVLHLPQHVVEAIERGDKTELPSYVFTRGYVRSYAKLMELEPEPLVAALSREYGVEEEPVAEVSDVAIGFDLQSLDTQQKTLLFSLVGGVGVLLLSLIVWWVWPEGSGPETGSSPDTEEMAQQDAGATTLQADQSQDEKAAGNADALAPRREPGRVQVRTSNQLDPDRQTVSSEPASGVVPAETLDSVDTLDPETTTQPGRETLLQQDQLLITVREDCWVEVKLTDGEVVFADLGRAGQVLDLAGQGPFSILLGYAPGVDLVFNGEDIALAPHTRNNVATFVIGQ